MNGLGRKLALGLVLGVVVVVVMSVASDARALGACLGAFDWPLYAAVLAITVAGYSVRFVKWHAYLRVLGHRPPVADSLLVFLAGMSMAATPGTLGELIKAVLLRDRSGVPAADTAAVVIADRATDVLALVVLSASGALATQYGGVVLGLTLVLVAVFIAVASSDRLSAAALGLVRRMPKGEVIAPKLEALRRATVALVRPGPLALATALSVVAWAGECYGLHLIVGGLPGTSPDPAATNFVFSFATLFGAVSMLPGGLGVAEGSMAGLLHGVFHVVPDLATATAATLLVRFATLWFGVLVGFVAWAVLRARPPVVAADGR